MKFPTIIKKEKFWTMANGILLGTKEAVTGNLRSGIVIAVKSLLSFFR